MGWSAARIYVLVLAMMCLCLGACGGGKSDELGALPTRFVLEQSSSPVSQSRLLDFWIPARGTLAAGQINSWLFAGQPGDNITLRALGISIDITLTLQNAGGVALAQGNDLSATLPEGGVYTVLVAGTGAGDYELGLGYADRPNPAEYTTTPLPEVVGVPTPQPAFSERGTFITELTDNSTLGGTLDENDLGHVYTFTGVAGKFAQIEMSRVSGVVDPVITIYNPEGAPIAMDDNSGGAVTAIVRNLQLPVDGIYSVQAEGSGFPGNYSITLLLYDERAPVTPTLVYTPQPSATTVPLATPTTAFAIPGNRLEDHVPVIGVLRSGDDVGIYPIYAAVGEILTIAVGPAEGSIVRAHLEVVDPDGAISAEADASTSNAGGDALITPLRAEIEGVYQVFVTSEDGSFGQYVVSYGSGSTRQNVMRGPIENDRAVQGDITRRGLRDVWTLPLSAGDIISVAATASEGSALDPILELVPADAPDTILAIDDNGGGGRDPLLSNISIPESGLYYLRVKASQAATTGGYSLIWRYVNLAPTSTPPPAVFPILTVDDVVPDSEYGFYPFQGQAGQPIEVQVIAGANSGLDPVLALIGPDGTILAEADDSDGTLNPRITMILPLDGTYTVRVNGYLSGGPFVLTVEALF